MRQTRHVRAPGLSCHDAASQQSRNGDSTDTSGVGHACTAAAKHSRLPGHAWRPLQLTPLALLPPLPDTWPHVPLPLPLPCDSKSPTRSSKP